MNPKSQTKLYVRGTSSESTLGLINKGNIQRKIPAMCSVYCMTRVQPPALISKGQQIKMDGKLFVYLVFLCAWQIELEGFVIQILVNHQIEELWKMF